MEKLLLQEKKRYFPFLNGPIEANKKYCRKKMCKNEPHLLEREVLAGRLVHCG